MEKYDAIVVGCGLSGATVARYMAESLNRKVLVVERRNHIGGNMYDYVDDDGILVHKYGPHTFHTTDKKLFDFMCKYSEWDEYRLMCGAVIDGTYTPTPFNYQTIDDFFSLEDAQKIKNAIAQEYPNRKYATVLEMLNSKEYDVKRFANFLFEKDYSLYTAKQWGVSPSEIDPSVLKRVPIRFNYDIGYFDDEFQVMPRESYTHFFRNLLKHDNIEIKLEHDFKDYVQLDEEHKVLLYKGNVFEGDVIYTGALDELLNYKYGELPYRSLRFEWRTQFIESFQKAPVVAYPQEEEFTRITEYTKLPEQNVGEKTTYAIEYPIPYKQGMKMEPYYPVLTEQSKEQYERYLQEIAEYRNLYLCGRLADFKYYNMDQALARAMELCEVLNLKYSDSV